MIASDNVPWSMANQPCTHTRGNFHETVPESAIVSFNFYWKGNDVNVSIQSRTISYDADAGAFRDNL